PAGPGDRPEGQQRLFEGVGGVGVVDDPADRGVRHRLHPPGDGARLAERLDDVLAGAADRGQQQVRGQGVGDVVAAGQGGVQGAGAVRPVDLDDRSVAVRTVLAGPVDGVDPGAGRVGRHRDLRLAGQAAAPVVVHADDAAPGVRGGEQGALGLVVGLHRAVEVEVVLGEVGEADDVVDDLVGAVQHQGVAGDLHGDHLDAVLGHAGQEAVQLRRLGGGAHGRDRVVAAVGGAVAGAAG